MKTDKKFDPCMTNLTTQFILGSLPMPTVSFSKPCQEEVGRKEPTMYDSDYDTFNDVAEAKDRLHNRVLNIECETCNSLRQKFGLENDDAPLNARELVKRVLDGRYVLPQEDGGWSGNLFNIKWRDPKKTPDQDGYDVVRKALSNLTTAAKDEIYVLPPADGLASLRKYEKDVAALVQ